MRAPRIAGAAAGECECLPTVLGRVLPRDGALGVVTGSGGCGLLGPMYSPRRAAGCTTSRGGDRRRSPTRFSGLGEELRSVPWRGQGRFGGNVALSALWRPGEPAHREADTPRLVVLARIVAVGFGAESMTVGPLAELDDGFSPREGGTRPSRLASVRTQGYSQRALAQFRDGSALLLTTYGLSKRGKQAYRL